MGISLIHSCNRTRVKPVPVEIDRDSGNLVNPCNINDREHSDGDGGNSDGGNSDGDGDGDDDSDCDSDDGDDDHEKCKGIEMGSLILNSLQGDPKGSLKGECMGIPQGPTWGCRGIFRGPKGAVQGDPEGGHARGSQRGPCKGDRLQ